MPEPRAGSCKIRISLKSQLVSVFESFEEMDAECAHRSSDDENHRSHPAEPVIRDVAKNNSDGECENHQDKPHETPYGLLARFHKTAVYLGQKRFPGALN